MAASPHKVKVLRTGRSGKREPAFVEPMQARLVQKLPDGDRWAYEAKFEGYRAVAVKNGDQVEIRSRNNKT